MITFYFISSNISVPWVSWHLSWFTRMSMGDPKEGHGTSLQKPGMES